MAKFRVLKIDGNKTIVKTHFVKDEAGNKVAVQEAVDVTMKVGAYGHEDIHVGDVIEINGHLADKARQNTAYFEEVTTEEAPEVEPEARKTRKRGAD